MRGRERTRLIQGLGRCTRNATDFAVVFWLGQSLINAIPNTDLVDGFPQDLRAELKWGIEQSRLAASDPEALAAMAEGLLTEAAYRKGANDQIGEWQAQLASP